MKLEGVVEDAQLSQEVVMVVMDEGDSGRGVMWYGVSIMMAEEASSSRGHDHELKLCVHTHRRQRIGA